MIVYDTLSCRFFKINKTMEEVKERLEKLNAILKDGGTLFASEYFVAIDATHAVGSVLNLYEWNGALCNNHDGFSIFKIGTMIDNGEEVDWCVVLTP